MQNRRILNGLIATLFTLLMSYQFFYLAITHRVENRVMSETRVGSNSTKQRSSSSLVCDKIDTTSGSSFQWIWEQQMKSNIMNVSLLSTNWTKDIRSNTTFTDWVEESMSYFTYSRLRHTMLSPPINQDRSIGRIHSILEEKLTNPDSAPPLQIVVFGGSVTTGHNCLDNIWDFPIRNDGHGNDRDGSTDTESKFCAWSGRLQDMMDEVLGPGVVEVTNLAIGGATTDMSTAVLEFGLIPGGAPDIFIWDHGTNDAITKVDPNLPFYRAGIIDSDEIFEKLQKFYQATIRLQNSCDKPDPPLVIMLDSFLGQQGKLPLITKSLSPSTATTKLLTWYPDIWGISYANTVRPYVLSNVNDQQTMLHLLGVNGVVTHPGMMYHMSVAWTIMFNLFYALYDNCVTRTILDTQRLTVQSLRDNKPLQTSIDYINAAYLTELKDDLRILDVPPLWLDRIPKSSDNSACLMKQQADTEAAKQHTAHSSVMCFYAWVVNKVLKVESPQSIQGVIQPYIVQNKGWAASGSNSKGGWLTERGKGSFFELQFEDVPIAVNSLTVIFMQSYSEMWVNSTLQIDCTFENQRQEANMTTKVNHDIPENDSTRTDLNISEDTATLSTISHFLSGYHTDETSILVPIKLPLPYRSSEVRKSTLRLRYQMLEGQTFKISGMALC